MFCFAHRQLYNIHSTFFPFGISTNLFGLESPQQCAACENVVGWTRIWFRYTLEVLSHWMFVVYFGGWREMLRHDVRQSSFVECKGHIFLLNRARLSCPPGCALLIQPHMQLFSPRWVLYWIITLEFYALSIKRHSKDGRLLRGVWNSTSWRGGRIDLIIQKKRRGTLYVVLCATESQKLCLLIKLIQSCCGESVWKLFGDYVWVDLRRPENYIWPFVVFSTLSPYVAAHNIYTHTRALSAAQKYKTANFFPSFVSGRRTIWLLRSTLFMWFIHGSLLNHFC